MVRRRTRDRIRVLVTGGPTRAYLDKVRFLSNYSSGELAYLICQKLRRKGMEVVLIAGPTSQPFEKLGLFQTEFVETAGQMRKAVLKCCRSFRPTFGVFAAAVLDFEPEKMTQGKVSSKQTKWTLALKPTPKIIDEVDRKFPSLRKVGFKLEWKRISSKKRDAFAQKNMKDKGLEVLCLNFLSEINKKKHPAFLYSSTGTSIEVQTKNEIASWISEYILYQ